MRYLFLIFIFFGHKSFAQQYVLSTKDSSSRLEHTEIRVILKKVKSLSKDRDLMQMKVVGVEYKEASPTEDLFVFSSVDPNKNKRVMNTSLMLNYFYLLKNPVLFEVERGEIYLDSVKLAKRILTQLEFWNIKKDSKRSAERNIYLEIEELAQKFYVPLPAAVLSGHMDSWEDADGYTQTVTKRAKGRLTLKTTGDKEIYKGSLVINKDRRILSGKFKQEITFTYNDGPERKGSYQNKIDIAKPSGKNPVDTLYLNMLVHGSSFSDACYVNNSFDSTRFINYLNRYKEKYSGDKSFVFYQLSGFQSFKNHTVYQSELKKIPTILLTGTHHLTNKINVRNLSLDEYLEVVSFFNKEELYNHLQHSLSQSFLDNRKESLDKLSALSTHGSEMIRNAVMPMKYWVNAKRNSENIDSLKFYAEKILQSGDDVWNFGNSGRYALLIYKLFPDKTFPSYSSEYLGQIIERLTPLYEDSGNTKKRIQEAHLAYAYYLTFEALEKTDPERAIQMLKQAALHSPKKEGSEHSSWYDRVFLKSKENYQEEYLNLLASKGKTDQALDDYVEEFLVTQDKTFHGLKSFFGKNYGADGFEEFFKKDVLSRLEDAPPFELLNLQATNYALKDSKGKWVLIDFWGTWCGPCVAEMPEINKFYNEIVKDKDSNIEFVSIACLDKPEKVENFLVKNKYNIPVLMSDSKVERDYKVRAYPSKFIISPEGKIIRLSIGFDWQDIIKELASL